MPGDFERTSWWIFNDLAGIPITYKELEKIVSKHVKLSDEHGPENGIEVVRENDNYTVFGVTMNGMTFNIAYRCYYCNQLSIGPPIIEDVGPIEPGALAGREGYDIKCGECKLYLDDKAFKLS